MCRVSDRTLDKVTGRLIERGDRAGFWLLT